MASLVLGGVGAFIGAPFGMASLGWSIGSAIGGMMEAPSLPPQVGPRLADLKVQTSNYGAPIAIVYGTYRLAGNVIWSTDMVESAHSSSSGGGKGGGGGGQSTTTYTYSCSFAVSLCEGAIVGITRVWLDGRVWSDTRTPEATANSASAEGQLTKYLGTEDQLPDPLMEADKGVGNVPAYRGQAYVVFHDLQLADFGNRVPNVSVEVVANTAPLVRDVVQDVCTRVGLGAIVPSNGADVVKGFAIGRQSTARVVVEQLQNAFRFDLIESDGAIALRDRGLVGAVETLEDSVAP